MVYSHISFYFKQMYVCTCKYMKYKVAAAIVCHSLVLIWIAFHIYAVSDKVKANLAPPDRINKKNPQNFLKFTSDACFLVSCIDQGVLSIFSVG